MCVSPSHVWVERGPKWEMQAVACRQCWRCRENRVNDFIGRCMAESHVSSETCAITLTYAPRSDLADKVLDPRHFQLFMKLLRRSGHKVRYFVAGEYGELKGRAHFHAILFFTDLRDRAVEPDWFGPVPVYNPRHVFDPETSGRFGRDIPAMQMCHIREWPHGHVKVDWTISRKAARYVCKYLLTPEKHNCWISMSKKPALGAGWFAQKASLSRAHGVLPGGFGYLPPGGDPAKSYVMQGATRRDYLNAISQDEADKPRMNEWVLKTFEKHERARVQAELDALPWEVVAASVAARSPDVEDLADRVYIPRSSAAMLLRYLRSIGDFDAKAAQIFSLLVSAGYAHAARRACQWGHNVSGVARATGVA